MNLVKATPFRAAGRSTSFSFTSSFGAAVGQHHVVVGIGQHDRVWQRVDDGRQEISLTREPVAARSQCFDLRNA